MQNGCQPRITAFVRAITVNDTSELAVLRLLMDWVDNMFAHVWYRTDSVDSTGKTNGITPLYFTVFSLCVEAFIIIPYYYYLCLFRKTFEFQRTRIKKSLIFFKANFSSKYLILMSLYTRKPVCVILLWHSI